jgi:uncharacterized protein YjbI with pentapeptide repeats
MADDNQLNILMRGVWAWNEWRYVQSIKEPDLSGADLRGMDLFYADFSGADLSEANLAGANLVYSHLSHANLRGANLRDADIIDAQLIGTNLISANLDNVDISGSDLYGANLGGASLGGAQLAEATFHRAVLCHSNLYQSNLSGADLSQVDLSHTRLGGADLRGASLIDSNLNSATLTGANLNDADIAGVLFTDIDLRGVKGLETIEHYGPSEVSTGTLALSEGQIPETFLRGCGLKDWEVEAAKLYRSDLTRDEVVEITYKVIELRSDPFIQFNSCFISYSSKNEQFARRLYSDLQECGVRCWFAPEHMKIGDRIRRRIDESIRMHDKLLLVLSESSVASQWIEQEVATALEKEREQGCDVLFPVRLDNAIEKVRSDWPALIRNTRHIGDFRHWKDPFEYEKAFARLLNDLRVEV